MESDLMPGTPAWAFDTANRGLAREYGITMPPEAWDKVMIERAPCLNVAWQVTMTEKIIGTYVVEVSGLGEILYIRENPMNY